MRSKLPSPRAASAHEASTTAWPLSRALEGAAAEATARAPRPSAGSASSSASPRPPRRPRRRPERGSPRGELRGAGEHDRRHHHRRDLRQSRPPAATTPNDSDRMQPGDRERRADAQAPPGSRSLRPMQPAWSGLDEVAAGLAAREVARRDGLLARVEVDRVGAVRVQVAEEAVLPAARTGRTPPARRRRCSRRPCRPRRRA